jgi:hypothetical protein
MCICELASCERLGLAPDACLGLKARLLGEPICGEQSGLDETLLALGFSFWLVHLRNLHLRERTVEPGRRCFSPPLKKDP